MADENLSNLSVKHVRRFCLECSGDCRRYVTWCPCDGLHSTRCELWPFRHGMQPSTFRAKYGGRLLTPEMMPPANLDLDQLPADVEAAALGAIDVEGYQQPSVDRPAAPELTEAERDRRAKAAERLRRARQAEPAAA